MGVPLIQQWRVGAYLARQRLRGNKRYPLVLMLEPLFRCNLACAGCGKIDYPDHILNKRLSVAECIAAVEECGAPMVAIPGGEPLLHKEIDQIVRELVKRKKFVSLCTNALLLEKKLDLFEPSPYLTFTVHLDGDREHHDKMVCQEGGYDVAVAAIRAAKARGFRVNINTTLFDGIDVPRMAAFFTFATEELKVDGINASPGYAYERAPDQEHFLGRRKTKELFRDIFRHGKARRASGGARWNFNQSSLFLDFLAGNQEYHCTPWSMPTRNVFGWQRPCYLIGEGYAKTYRELMDTTRWDDYGTGKYEKCANCMVHCGYEGTAVEDTFRKPLKALAVALRGPRTEGPMAQEIDLSKARPAERLHEKHVYEVMAEVPLTARDKRWFEGRGLAVPAERANENRAAERPPAVAAE
jgi:hopanoid biosynthesis associated radical SAM protein HpnH